MNGGKKMHDIQSSNSSPNSTLWIEILKGKLARGDQIFFFLIETKLCCDTACLIFQFYE